MPEFNKSEVFMLLNDQAKSLERLTSYFERMWNEAIAERQAEIDDKEREKANERI